MQLNFSSKIDQYFVGYQVNKQITGDTYQWLVNYCESFNVDKRVVRNVN